jgi:hypothetical protein
MVFQGFSSQPPSAVASLREFAPAQRFFLALMVTITVAILIDVKFCSIPVPWWYQFGFLTLGPLAVIITPVFFGSSKQQGSVT